MSGIDYNLLSQQACVLGNLNDRLNDTFSYDVEAKFIQMKVTACEAEAISGLYNMIEEMLIERDKELDGEEEKKGEALNCDFDKECYDDPTL